MKRVGFYLNWNRGSLSSSSGNVLGDELYALSLVKAIRQIDSSIEADVYAPNYLPPRRLDAMIYMNDNQPRKEWAHRSVLYLQNGYGKGSAVKLKELRRNHYDGYAFISRKLLSQHQKAGYQGLFLPFGVDVSNFYPRPQDPDLSFEVAYVGNDIKGVKRTQAFLEPAVDFRFGLFGNWHISKSRVRIWKNWFLPSYKRKFEHISRGKIPQEKVPVLYSSSMINLNCTIQDCVDWDVITLRTLEILACNGFLISDRVPSAESLLGDFVVFTDGQDDLKEKIRRYIDDSVTRTKMACAGGEYVRNHFSVHATASSLLKYLQEI